MSTGGIVSIITGLLFVALAGLEAKLQLRMPLWLTWPVGTAVVVAGVGFAGATNEGQVLHRLREGAWTLSIIVVATSYMVWLIGRHLRWSGLRTSVLALAIALAQTMTLIPDGGYPPRLRVDASPSLVACATGESPIDVLSMHQFKINVLPNIAVFVPVGIAFALCLRRRWLAFPIIVGFSIAIEAYQAMFTNRLCAPVDVLANTIGGWAGALLVIVTAAAARLHEVNRRST